MIDLDALVEDWGGFEELVKDIHEDGNVSVQRGVTLVGKSGATREIDVLIRHQSGPYSYLTLVECKHWRSRVKREQIDVLHSSMMDLNASKGILFTTRGFQNGARTYAQSKGIEIFVLRDLTNEEWGKPGRVIDLILQIVSKTIMEIRVVQASSISLSPDEIATGVQLDVDFGSKNGRNRIVSSQRDRYLTIEEYLTAASEHAVKEFNKAPFAINGGAECTQYCSLTVNMPFGEDPLEIEAGGKMVSIDRIEMEVGIRVEQSQLQIDRARHYLYALAVEDCIRSSVQAVSRASKDGALTRTHLSRDASSDGEGIVENGSIVSVATNGFFDPGELDGLTRVDCGPLESFSQP